MNPLNKQEGGSHYKDFAIQPVEFINKNGIPFIEGCVIKYLTRHRHKNGAEDIRKAIHFLELLIQLEYDEENKKEFRVSGSGNDIQAVINRQTKK